MAGEVMAAGMAAVWVVGRDENLLFWLKIVSSGWGMLLSLQKTARGCVLAAGNGERMEREGRLVG